VLSSRPHCAVSVLTYDWYLEMRRRSHTIEYLTEHDISEMDDNNGWPTLHLPKQELQQRKTLFKKRAFWLLYQLADCTAGLNDTHRIRTAQARFLECLSQVELSVLGCMVEIVGHGFFTITKKSLSASALANLGDTTSRIMTSGLSETLQPSSTPWHNLNDDNWIRECM